MCVWSAYVGTGAAAPLLWETGTRIEHIWSGFYTGLLTLENGVFHSAKCQGDSGYWLREFSLDRFPGNIGFFHSRTNSGGDYRRAHPFVSSGERVALVSQGSAGQFITKDPLFQEAAKRLHGMGKMFSSCIQSPDCPTYTAQPRGEQVHVSEVVVNAVEAEYERSGDPFQAISRTVCELPEEALSLFIFKDYPETIYIGNVNQRAVVSFGDGGASLAITALAWGPPFPAFTEIPPNSVTAVTASTLETRQLEPGYQVNTATPVRLLSAVTAFLKNNGPATLAQLADQVLRPLFPAAGLQCRAAAAYRLIETLAAEKRITFHPVKYDFGCLAEIRLTGD